MGGPCFLDDGDGGGGSGGAAGRREGPPCTDNFQVRPFVYDGVRFHSCEQAYQALKFARGSEGRRAVEATTPEEEESDCSHGHRAWAAGNDRGAGGLRPDWVGARVLAMLGVNRAKYEQHPDLRAELLATGTAAISGGPSTTWEHPPGHRHGWNVWNGRIQTLIREELQPPEARDQALIAALLAQFAAYGSSTMPAAAAELPEASAMAAELAELRRHGFELPWSCPACSFINGDYPSICELCDGANPAYAAARARRAAAAAAAAAAPAACPTGSGPSRSSGPRLICIGDLHGNLQHTKALWGNLERRLGVGDVRRADVVFLGDYCDRGPDTRGMIDWLIGLRDARAAADGGATTFLAGNHDFALAAYLGALPVGVPTSAEQLEATAVETTPSRSGRNNMFPSFSFPVDGGMHYQGRRYGGPKDLYSARSTFASYGVAMMSTAEVRVEAGTNRYHNAVFPLVASSPPRADR